MVQLNVSLDILLAYGYTTVILSRSSLKMEELLVIIFLLIPIVLFFLVIAVSVASYLEKRDKEKKANQCVIKAAKRREKLKKQGSAPSTSPHLPAELKVQI